jgi:hypothetical protein
VSRRIISREILEHEGERFKVIAFPHEHGRGYSYNIQITDAPGDVIHLDTKIGTVFTEEEIVSMREYFKHIREVRGSRGAP